MADSPNQPDNLTPESFIRSQRSSNIPQRLAQAAQIHFFCQWPVRNCLKVVEREFDQHPARQQWALAALPSEFVNQFALATAGMLTVSAYAEDPGEIFRIITSVALFGKLDLMWIMNWATEPKGAMILQDFLDLLVSHVFIARGQMPTS